MRSREYDTWFLELIRQPGNARIEYGFWGRYSGRILYGYLPWMAPVDPGTSSEVLSELFVAVLDLGDHQDAFRR